MSDFMLKVTESKEVEVEERRKRVSARRLNRHRSSQVHGGLGPKIRESLWNKGRLMLNSCNLLPLMV